MEFYGIYIGIRSAIFKRLELEHVDRVYTRALK